ncbi:MAG: DUF3592 domain-containing protein [Balneolales bacterium]|nr:DUF3592 domain-containing protein [Balneolales bacterium]
MRRSRNGLSLTIGSSGGPLNSAITILIFIVAPLIATGYFWMQTQDFLSTAEFAEGEVVSYHEYTSDGTRMYSPIVEFTLPDGNKLQFTSNFGSSSQSYQIGEKVEVVYRIDDPESARISSIMNLYGFVIFSGAFALAGMVFQLVAKAHRNKITSDA